MIDFRTREIRAVLIGWVRYEGIFCIASENIRYSHFNGLNNGAGEARFRGLKELRTQYEIPKKFNIEGKVFSNIVTALGQPVFLRSSPNTLATLSRPFLMMTPPVLVTIELGDNDRSMLCCFYTAKTLLARLRLRHVANRLGTLLPNELKETAVTLEPEAIDFDSIRKTDEAETESAEKTENESATQVDTEDNKDK